MSSESVLLERDGHVASIVLARPSARNALTDAMGSELERVASELAGDRSVRVVLVRGEGAGFCAGGDLGFIEQRIASGREDNRVAMRRFYERFLSLRSLPVPTIAVVHGAAMGAGVCLALACDLRLVAKNARLGLNFVRLGLPPGMGATFMLPRLVGPGAAASLLLTGKTIGAEEALRIGLADALFEGDELASAAQAMAREIATAAPGAVRATLRALRGHPLPSLDAALDAEAEAQAVEYGSKDILEGLRAARERRAPVFRGEG